MRLLSVLPYGKGFTPAFLLQRKPTILNSSSIGTITDEEQPSGYVIIKSFIITFYNINPTPRDRICRPFFLAEMLSSDFVVNSPVSSGAGKTTGAAQDGRKPSEQVAQTEKDEDSGSDYEGNDWGVDAWTGDEWNDAQVSGIVFERNLILRYTT